MSTFWDLLPPNIQNNGALSSFKPLLNAINAPSGVIETEDGRRWKKFTHSFGANQPLAFDIESGQILNGANQSNDSNLLEFPNSAAVQIELALRLVGDVGETTDGVVRLRFTSPSAILHIPFLRGATLDNLGQLRSDPSKPVVKFFLPALRLQLLSDPIAGFSFKLLSASIGTPVDQIYDFVRMDPPYALIGPGDVVGFSFRTAVLDLSGVSGASGVPANAKAQPDDWQGLYLPEAKMYVAPQGLEGIAVSGGVRDLWVGIGKNAGVTGIFEAEVVNRGSSPNLRLRFQTDTGRWIGVPDADINPTVQLPGNCTLYADAGSGLAPYTYTINGNSTDRLAVTPPNNGTLSINVTVSDAQAHSVSRNLTISKTAAISAVAPENSIQIGVSNGDMGSTIIMQSPSGNSVTLSLDPPKDNVTWTINGVAEVNPSPTVSLQVAVDQTVNVSVKQSIAASSTQFIDAYLLFDRPFESDVVSGYAAFALNGTNVRTSAASSKTGFANNAPMFISKANLQRLNALPNGTTLQVDGFASYENDDSSTKQTYNQKLSERRRNVLLELLKKENLNNLFAAEGLPAKTFNINSSGIGHGHVNARDHIPFDKTLPNDKLMVPAPAETSGEWWRARIIAVPPSAVDTSLTTTLSHPSIVPNTPATEVVPSAPKKPDCFRKLGFAVELTRGTFVRAEVWGEFDVQTAAENRLSENGAGALPARDNPSDGICTFLVRFKIAEDRSSWETKAEFRAINTDKDGLAQVKNAAGDNSALNMLGAVTTLAPLLSAITPPSPKAGELVPLAVATGVVAGIGAAGVIKTHEVTLYGGELVVTNGLVDPASGDGPRDTQVSIMLDVETALSFDLVIVKVPADKPIRTRYKAVGVRSSWRSVPRVDGTVEYIPLPVFDPSRGYSLDIPAGAMVAKEPLGSLLRVLGIKVSKDNPTYLEVEVGMGIDLGPITIDTARVRLRLDQAEFPQLTKLGATLDIPGAIHGVGVVEITNLGFKGAFDITITPMNIRAFATLAVESKDGVTGVLIGAEVTFPVPIVLGTSGLGIYGFLGGVGVNYARKEPSGVSVPALKWLEDQLSPSRNSVMHPDGWELSAGHFAVAAGVLMGTVEGGFVLHMKGIVIIEVPGPRLLLVMKADVLSLPPLLKSQQSAAFLAMLDLDIGRGTITIGLVAQYDVVKLLHVRVPVTAFFNTNHPDEWLVDLGNFNDPVSVKVLDVFSGTGYVMVHGNGLTHPTLNVTTYGLTVAAGFHIVATLMGSKAARLYLEASAGFDALVSLKPEMLIGKVYVRGELRLFIISISASAELDVIAAKSLAGAYIKIHGEVCGEVDFFFFSVKGCVSMTIEEGNLPQPIAPPLVSGVKLVSRSPALLEGSATDLPLDGALGDAVVLPIVNPAQALPEVPLDSVPVVFFEVSPLVASTNVVLGGTPLGNSGASANQWIQRGDTWWTYRIDKVELLGNIGAGDKPSTWWARPAKAGLIQSPALALLSWSPTPISRAVPYGEQLIRTITEEWGHVCNPVAKPAAIFWTFDKKPFGSSSVGWSLDGIVWPDEANAYRSTNVDSKLNVTERWRTGNQQADRIQGTSAARVVGDIVACPSENDVLSDDFRSNPLAFWYKNQPLTFSKYSPLEGVEALKAIATQVAKGTPLMDASTGIKEAAWDPAQFNVVVGNDVIKLMSCQGKILRSPTGDIAEPAPFGQDSDHGFIKNVWDQNHFRPSELEDSIVLANQSGWSRLRVLLLVPVRELREGFLQCAALNKDGKTLTLRKVTLEDLVTATNPLPAQWADPQGPWFKPLQRAGRIAARVAATQPAVINSRRALRLPSHLLVLVNLETPEDCSRVEIGWDRSLTNGFGPAFWMVSAEGMTTAEQQRYDWDNKAITEQRKALESALKQDQDDHALLMPGQDYTVKVSWSFVSITQKDKPNSPPSASSFTPSQSPQEFRFRTTSQAPLDLKPWVLATSPSMGEIGIFCKEPVRIALAHSSVAKLFDAYNKELRVVVRSASGKHPEPPGGGSAGASFKIPLAVDGAVISAAKELSHIMTPWQQVLTEVASEQMPCIDSSGSQSHPVIIKLDYVFEPLTDYILDVMSVEKGSPEGTAGDCVLRINFTTARFDQHLDLASILLNTVVEHALIPSQAGFNAIAALPPAGKLNQPKLTVPAGVLLDNAYQSAGLNVPQVPRYPRLQVLWSDDPTPQPVAIVVESSEPLWRSRPMPTVVEGPPDLGDPMHKWWAARLTDWLGLKESELVVTTGDLVNAMVTKIVMAPGGMRAVVLLAPNQRGTCVRLDLVLFADKLAGSLDNITPAVRINLIKAPWEVEL